MPEIPDLISDLIDRHCGGSYKHAMLNKVQQANYVIISVINLFCFNVLLIVTYL